METFPIFKAGTVYNPIKLKYGLKSDVCFHEIEIFFPCRLDAMAINPAGVCGNECNVFTPGEVVISVALGIKVKVRVCEGENQLFISDATKRKVLVKHAFGLMLKAYNKLPSLFIDVDSTKIFKHCGFGSSSATIAAVCSAINEIMGKQIKSKDLIKYCASNHGEEVDDADVNNMKVVQCIGGGATSGLTNKGIMVIAGKATTIASMNFVGDVLIGIPNEFKEKDAKILMELEEQNLWKFKKTGEQYKNIIAYDLLHKAIPAMVNEDISELAKIVFNYRFYMGSNLNCSFVCDAIVAANESLKVLFEGNHCRFLALSSVGPAFFVICDKKEDIKYCERYMQSQNMKVIKTKIYNKHYRVIRRI